MAALTAYPDLWAAGVDIVGISNLATFLENTSDYRRGHREAEYGSLSRDRDFLEQIAPINHVDRLTTPLILLQGTDDRVVPPNQAESMAAALRERGLPVALVMFEGEGHGFRDPTNRARALECELSFYAQVFGFTPAGDIPPVEVENLPPARM